MWHKMKSWVRRRLRIVDPYEFQVMQKSQRDMLAMIKQMNNRLTTQESELKTMRARIATLKKTASDARDA